MHLLIIMAIVVAATVIVLGVGFLTGWLLRWRIDRQQLHLLTTELTTEAQMDGLTRATLHAMRQQARAEADR